jgi:hypothetical protein
MDSYYDNSSADAPAAYVDVYRFLQHFDGPMVLVFGSERLALMAAPDLATSYPQAGVWLRSVREGTSADLGFSEQGTEFILRAAPGASAKSLFIDIHPMAASSRFLAWKGKTYIVEKRRFLDEWGRVFRSVREELRCLDRGALGSP